MQMGEPNTSFEGGFHNAWWKTVSSEILNLLNFIKELHEVWEKFLHQEVFLKKLVRRLLPPAFPQLRPDATHSRTDT